MNLRPAVLAAPFVLTLFSVGCGSPPSAEVEERLWLSDFPTGPRAQVNAFMITEVRGKRMGAFYRGSVYRGRHDAFSWTQTGKQTGRIRFLQDGKTHELAIKGCEPTRGFDHCIVLEGDPTGTSRYQSRKRWAVPRRGRRSLDPATVMLEIADEDDELATAFELDE